MTLQKRQVDALERIADALEALGAASNEGIGMPMGTTAVPQPVSAAEIAASQPMHTTVAHRKLSVQETDQQPPLPREVLLPELPDDTVEPMGDD